MEENMSNIINNFKNMLDNSNSNSDSNETQSNSSSNLNITPDMLSKLLGSIKTMDNTNNEGNNKKSNDSSVNNSSQSNDSFSNGIDLETILKIKTIMETLNKKDDPRSNLLYSLKPYLRETRQKKLDQYVNLFKISQVTNIFKTEKGDRK